MTDKDLMPILTLFFERSNAMQTFWNFYISVVLGLVGFSAAAKIDRNRRIVAAALLTAGFFAFVWVNLSGLLDVSAQRIDACLHLAVPENVVPHPDTNLNRDGWTSVFARIKKPVEITLNPSTPKSVAAFHLTTDAVVVGTLWFLALRRDRAE